MSAQLRQRVWRLHSILGILLGLPLFIMFFAGSIAFFVPESVNWTHPEIAKGYDGIKHSLDPIIQEKISADPEFKDLTIRLATKEHPVTDLYMLSSDGEFTHEWIHPATSEVLSSPDHDGDLAHFLVDLHYLNFFPGGKEIAGVIAMLFSVIIITGLLYQLKRLKDDFSWNKLKRLRKTFWRSWHRTLSFVTFPFQVIFAITGGVLALGFLSMAPSLSVFFDNDLKKIEAAIYPEKAHSVETLNNAPVGIDHILNDAQSRWGAEVEPFVLHMASKNDILHYIIEGRDKSTHIFRQHFIAYSEDGALLQKSLPGEHLGSALIDGVVTLHFANFGEFWLDLVFSVIGFIVALSIAFGILIILSRQKVDKLNFLTKLFRATVYAILFGLPLAVSFGLFMTPINPIIAQQAFFYVILILVALFLYKPSKVNMQIITFISAVITLAAPVSFALSRKVSMMSFESYQSSIASIFNVYMMLSAVITLVVLAVWLRYTAKEVD